MNAEAPIVVGLGELLCDCDGAVRTPGGAPANVAFHAQQLGLHGIVVSRVGRDVLGDELLEHLVRHGLTTAHVLRDAHHETGRALVERDADGQPRYHFPENVAFDHLEFAPYIEQLMIEAAAICFGTLAQRHIDSRRAIQQCLTTAQSVGATPQRESDRRHKGRALLVYDVNVRKPHWERETVVESLHLADVAKLNQEEVQELAKLLAIDARDDEIFAAELSRRHRLELVCVTRGAGGAMLWTPAESVEAPAPPVQAVDVIGAGDAFSAALIYARLANWPLGKTAAFANEYAALVASRAGAMPDLSDVLPELWRRYA